MLAELVTESRPLPPRLLPFGVVADIDDLGAAINDAGYQFRAHRLLNNHGHIARRIFSALFFTGRSVARQETRSSPLDSAKIDALEGNIVKLSTGLIFASA
jgi:cob(I)alamin adenosyltransferase